VSLPPLGTFPGSACAVQARAGASLTSEDAAATAGFDELLAALLSRAGAEQLARAGDPASEQHDHTGAGAEQFLGDGNRSPDRDAAVRQLAEMFNEHGLFLGATADEAATVGPQPVVATGRERTKGDGKGLGPRPPGAARIGSLPQLLTAQPGPSSVGYSEVPDGRHESAAAPTRVEPRSGPMRAGSQAKQGLSLAGRIASPPERMSAEAEAGSLEPVPEGGPFNELVREGGATAAQLLVQAAEGEVNLFARVERLSREERARLRIAIEHLLASHGFAAGEIRLGGDVANVRRL
jgi:hypothetical protein